MFDLSLYVITDKTLSQGRSHLDIMRASLAGGATMIQLREKEATSLAFYQEAMQLLPVCRQYQVPLIINDRVDIALAVDADGVHVGQDDLPADVVRRIIGPDKILGVSASTVDEALQAQRDGAQYIGVGAVYGTATKADAGAAIGVERLKDIAAAVSIPVVAIGGIQTHNISAVIQTGVQGVAVISAVVSQPDVEEATRKLLELVRQNQ